MLLSALNMNIKRITQAYIISNNLNKKKNKS